MGIETGLALLSTVVGVIGGIAQASAASEAAAAQKEANAVAGGQQKVNSLEDRRRRVREERVRRAQIIAASENQGTSGSSGEAGALGSLGTNFTTLISSSRGESRSNESINVWNQKAADATARGNMIGALTDTALTGIRTFGTIFD